MGIGYTSAYKGTLYKENLKHPEKYADNKPIVYRSALEYNYFMIMDSNSGFTKWASESIEIQYSNPLKEGEISRYFPDLICTMKKKNNEIINLIIEIKPQSELDNVLNIEKLSKEKKQTKKFLRAVQNQAKWNAAQKYCEELTTSSKNPWTFVVMTEKDLKRFSK